MYISGEDEVTKAIIYRIMDYCSPRLKVFKEIPARGGEIKNKIKELNLLSRVKPVILLTDLDANDCAPAFKDSLLNGVVKNDDFLVNIAIDEAEAWLMADRKGFSDYFGIPIESIPSSSMQKMGGRRQVNEMDFKCKSSWLLTHDFIRKSSKIELKQQIEVTGTATKGKEYNSAILPFINDVWNIDAAMENSDSLSRMVKRLRNLTIKYT